MLNSHKKVTIRYFDKNVLEYEEEKKDFIKKFFQKQFDHFVNSVKKINGKKILDLGSGPGRDGLLFKKEGFHSVCVDLSEAMINHCKEHGLEAYVMDFYDLKFPDNSFDAIWASFSLLHAPKKNLPKILKDIKRILKPNGVFMISVFEGSSEGIRKELNKREVYISYYKEDELKNILKDFFEINIGGLTSHNPDHPPGLYFECSNRK